MWPLRKRAPIVNNYLIRIRYVVCCKQERQRASDGARVTARSADQAASNQAAHAAGDRRKRRKAHRNDSYVFTGTAKNKDIPWYMHFDEDFEVKLGFKVSPSYSGSASARTAVCWCATTPRTKWHLAALTILLSVGWVACESTAKNTNYSINNTQNRTYLVSTISPSVGIVCCLLCHSPGTCYRVNAGVPQMLLVAVYPLFIRNACFPVAVITRH